MNERATAEPPPPEGPRTFGIFVSYRRGDSGHAGRLYDALAARFGADSVFMDVDAIDPGVDFAETIDRAVRKRLRNGRAGVFMRVRSSLTSLRKNGASGSGTSAGQGFFRAAGRAASTISPLSIPPSRTVSRVAPVTLRKSWK